MDRNIGPIEIKKPDGEYFYTEVYREGGKLVAGIHTNTCLLLYDEWEVVYGVYLELQQKRADKTITEDEKDKLLNICTLFLNDLLSSSFPSNDV